MNRDRVHRRYRRGSKKAPNLCLRCFQFGHYRNNCKNEPIVTCGNCFRAYYFSTECPCNQNDQGGMTLRMVGGEPFPRPCIDVMIGNNTYEALLNQSKSRTTINLEVLNYINFLKEQNNLPTTTSDEITNFNIKRRQKEVMVEIEVNENQTDPIIIGMEFLIRTGFDLTVDKVSVNQFSPVVDNSTTVDFLYNLSQGNRLRSWLEARNRPLYNKYQKGEPALLQEEPRIVINNDQNQQEEHEHQHQNHPESDVDVLDLHTDTDDLDIL